MMHGTTEQMSEFLIGEDFQRATRWNFTHSSRVKIVMVIAISRLYKDAAIGQTFCVDLTDNIVQMDTW